VFGCRLLRAVPGDPGKPWQPSGTVLVTGGAGALGAHVARWLAGSGADHLILTSRQASTAPGVDDLTAELEGLGCRVTVTDCDASDREALAELLATVPGDAPLTAVLHVAGLVDDASIESLTPERLVRVFAAKVAAVRNLHELTAHLDLGAFVMFSAAGGTFGSTGQANYAAANAFLDAFARYRRANGLVATSVAWGAWGGGSLDSRGDVEARLRSRGVRAMAPEPAMEALHQALRDDETHLLVADIDWDRFAPGLAALRPMPLLTTVPEARKAMDSAVAAAEGADQDTLTVLRERLAGLSEAEAADHVLHLVRSTLAKVLGFGTPDTLDVDDPLTSLGLDSVMAVEFRNRLGRASGLRLPVTLVFDYPTSRVIAGHLHDQLRARDGDPADALLEGLEARLPAIAADASARQAVATRLQSMLALLAGEPDDREPEDLAAATDQELIDFIGKEFGIS
jgi:NAD(P)-dependent dehydrogenase (short-subunit alcohol dehydrogenase family)